MADPHRHLHDILNTSDHLLDISSEHESLTHHPSLLSAYESELQFDESTIQHETEPYRSQVADSMELNDMDGTSADNFTTQSDSHTDQTEDKGNFGDEMGNMKSDDRVFSSSPVNVRATDNKPAESEEDDEMENPYSSYQQFHRDLSTHDEPKSELIEFETLEQENTDTATPELGVNIGEVEHKSRRDKWVDNSTSDITSLSNNSKSRQGKTSPSRIPTASSQPATPTSLRSRTPTGSLSMRKSKSQSLTRDRSPSATRRSPSGQAQSGRRSVSADTKLPAASEHKTGIPSPVFSKSPPVYAERKRRNMSGSQIPLSRPLTPSSSLRSLDRQSSPEPRSEFSEAGSSRPSSRLPRRSKKADSSVSQNPSRTSVEPRKFLNHSTKPSKLPSARPSVTSATELTSQDEQSPDLDLSSDEEAGLGTSNQHEVTDPIGVFMTQPNNSVNFRNPPLSETLPLSTMLDTHDQASSLTDKSATEPPQTAPKLKTTKTTTTTIDYEEIETTKTTTKILAQSSPKGRESTPSQSGSRNSDYSRGDKSAQRSKSQNAVNRLRQAERMMERRALSESRSAADSPSQFGEAKALNDAIRLLEARETKDTKSSTEKSSWTPTIPDDMGDNSRPMSSTWTSLADYNQAQESKSNNAIIRADEVELGKPVPVQKEKSKEEMSRQGHSHLPNAANHAHYALPTTSYLHKYQGSSGRRDSSSSDLPLDSKKRSPRRKRLESDQSAATRSKLDQSDLTLDTSTRDNETESEELVKQLQTDFDDLLSKYAMAEVTIDQLRLGAKLNLYSDPAQPSQATIVQNGTARSATTLTLPQKGQASLNSSLQSAAFGYNYPGLSPRQHADAGILIAAPPTALSDSQKALQENVLQLQDQVGSFIAGVSGEGRVFNLNPAIHHQLYEALEQSQDTLHHQLIEEKNKDPFFDSDNDLAGQLHQIRMSMDEHIDKLPQIQQPPRVTPQVHAFNSDEETMSHTPSSLNTAHSGSTSVQRPKRANDQENRGNRKGTPQGSRASPSYTAHSSSADDDILTDDDTVRPRSHQLKSGASNNRLKPQSKRSHHGAASNSSNGGSDHGQGLKSRARIQGSSDSGFIGSEEGKSPNTPSDRHLSGLPTIHSQAENSGIDSPRALTPDLSESRTAEWALKHKLPIEVGGEHVLPEPPKGKRTQSRSSRKSVRSERSGQSSLRSDALRSIQSEIEKLRDDFNAQQQSLPSPDRQRYGSPMRATYQLPANYKSPSEPKPQPANSKADVRNSDLDLSEVEGGRGFTPAPQSRPGQQLEYYPSTDEDPRLPPKHSEQNRRGQPPHEQRPLQETHQHRPRDLEHRHGHSDNEAVNPEYTEQAHRPVDERQRYPYKPSTASEGKEMAYPSRSYPPRQPDPVKYDTDRRERRSPSADRRRTDRDYSPGRTPSSLYEYNRPYYRDEVISPDYRPDQRSQRGPEDRGRRHTKPSSVRSTPSQYDEPHHRGQRSDSRAQRSANRGDMSPISERPYDSPEREYYRRYKSPLRRTRSFHEDRLPTRPFNNTMEELNSRDLNQTTLPLDSTVHTHHSRTPNIATPNAVSTPYHPHSQSQAPAHTGYQPQQPLHQNYHTLNQPQASYQQPAQQAIPVQQVPIQPPGYQQSVMTSLPAHHSVYHPEPMRHTVTPANTQVPAVTDYSACPSCCGRGVLPTSHSCASCGSRLKSIQPVNAQVASLQLANHPSSVMLTNQTGAVVIPVANEKQSQAYLTQHTPSGYLTQTVNVIDSTENIHHQLVSSHAPIVSSTRAVPVMETSPSGKVRYYVREYGATSSDGEPSRSKSSRRRERSRDRHSAAESMDDLESSLRDARRSAQSLKRLSRGMRDGLQDELVRSLHRRSLSSSWAL